MTRDEILALIEERRQAAAVQLDVQEPYDEGYRDGFLGACDILVDLIESRWEGI